MNTHQCLIAAALLAAATQRAATAGFTTPVLDLGPLAIRDRPLDSRETERVRGLGPILEERTAPNGERFRALRPFISHVRDASNRVTSTHVLWPLATHRRSDERTSWHVLTVRGRDSDNRDRASSYSLMAFPFLFWGRDSHGDSYVAVFPLGGRINSFMFRDKIVFALFPLYTYSAVNEVRTHDVLWPIFSLTHGKDVLRFRVFPLFGRAIKKGRSDKMFVLWPLWTSARYVYGDASGRGFMLFPLFGHVKLENQESWYVLPPFFRWSRGQRQNLIYAPWPFIQVGSGKIDKLYVWPFWGRKRRAGVDSTFFLWPIGSSERSKGRDYDFRRYAIRPFAYMKTRTALPKGDEPVEPHYRYVKIWPFACYERKDQVRTLRVLDLWPFENPRGIERNWAPLWTLYSCSSTPEARDHELLWGLFRRRVRFGAERHTSLFPLVSWQRNREEDSRRWSLLHGLLEYRRAGAQRTYRLLYFWRIHRGEPAPR